MKLGVMIEHGLSDWQILQQKEGWGSLRISGSWHYEEGEVSGVYVRVVKEESREVVIPWRRATDTAPNQWVMAIDDVPVGGLYCLETCLSRPQGVMEWATRGDMVHCFGVGDLYVIAGQSNSAGYGKDPVFDAPELGVHLFANDNRWRLATHPLNDSTGTAHEINREASNPGNSPYLSFAKYLKREMHYPIGLVQTSLGGSPLSRWNPEEEGDLYENMIEIIRAVGGSVKGILWYQGCSDVGKTAADSYFNRFASMVSHLRAALNDAELPVLTVQLDRCTLEASAPDGDGWSRVRDAQRCAAKEIAHVTVVPTLDFSLSDCIHVSAASNVVLGERMAKQALQAIYAKPFFAQAPDLTRAIRRSDDEICLSFAPVYDRLYCYEVHAGKLAFEVEDDRGVNPIQEYEISEKGSEITLKLERSIAGQAYVHHARGSDPIGWSPVDFATHLPVLAFYRVPVGQ